MYSQKHRKNTKCAVNVSNSSVYINNYCCMVGCEIKGLKCAFTLVIAHFQNQNQNQKSYLYWGQPLAHRATTKVPSEKKYNDREHKRVRQKLNTIK